MTAILFMELQGFYVQNDKNTSEGSPSALVVYHLGVVLDACPMACQMGVKIGSTLSEAKAILREKGRFVQFCVDDYAAPRNLWLDQLLSAVAGVEVEMPHRAYVDLTRHPNPESVASQLIRQVQQMGYSVRAGLARAKWISQLAASHIPPTPEVSGINVIEHIWDSTGFLNAFPTRMLLPILPDHRERLEFLGYRWVRDVAKAPLSLLIEQFGKHAYAIHACASGLTLDKVEPNYPQNSLMKEWNFGFPVSDSAVIAESIERLCGELSGILCSRDEMSQEMRVTFVSESDYAHTLFRRFARPVFRALSLQVAVMALAPPDQLPFAPVSIRILLSNNVSSVSYQRTLMGHQSAELRLSSCDGAIKSLQAAYGSEIVSPASCLTSPRRIEVMRVWKKATGWCYGSGIRGG